MVKGIMGGFAIREASAGRKNILISGLDKSWDGKKVLLILLE
jgi:hypothetical protein